MEMKKQRKAEEWKASSEDIVKMQENPGSLLKNCNYQSFHIWESCHLSPIHPIFVKHYAVGTAGTAVTAGDADGTAGTAGTVVAADEVCTAGAA